MAKKYTQEQLTANLELLIERFKLHNENWLDNNTYIFNAAVPMLRETIKRLETTPPTTSTESTTGSAESDADAIAE